MECINRKVGKELSRSGHPDLKRSVITPDLVSCAADAVADLFEMEGFHLTYTYESGDCVYQSFYSPTTREQLVDVEFSLVQVDQIDQTSTVALAVRASASGAFSNSRNPVVYSGAIRIAGAWFSTLRDGIGAAQLIAALKEKPTPKSLCMHNFLARYVPTPVQSRMGGIYA
jgi:hypothetical protein